MLDNMPDDQFAESLKTPEQKMIEELEVRVAALESLTSRLAFKRHWHYVNRAGEMSNPDKPYREGYY
jgi:hypothetical protein